MLRAIGGFIVGWIVMAVLVMATFVVTIMALGWDKTLQPDSYWTTETFNIIVLIGGFIAAIVGGMVCKLIARSSTPTFVLIAVVLAFGLVGVVMNMNKPDPPVRIGEVTMQDIAQHGKEPTWFAFTKVILAAAGLVIGSSLVGRKPAAQ